MTESWPDHSAELARKAMECITAKVAAFQDGKLSAAALWLTADILSEVTQGLIDKDTWNTVYAVRGEASKLAKAKK